MMLARSQKMRALHLVGKRWGTFLKSLKRRKCITKEQTVQDICESQCAGQGGNEQCCGEKIEGMKKDSNKRW